MWKVRDCQYAVWWLQRTLNSRSLLAAPVGSMPTGTHWRKKGKKVIQNNWTHQTMRIMCWGTPKITELKKLGDMIIHDLWTQSYGHLWSLITDPWIGNGTRVQNCSSLIKWAWFDAKIDGRVSNNWTSVYHRTISHPPQTAYKYIDLPHSKNLLIYSTPTQSSLLVKSWYFSQTQPTHSSSLIKSFFLAYKATLPRL